MKYKKLILCLALIFSIIYIVYPYTMSQEAYVDIKDDIIRFHVRANSDKEEDQDLKLKVRDRILKETKPLLQNCKSIEESRIIMENNLDNIKKIAEEVIEEQGKDYPVHVSLGMENFPTRKYGNVVFPAGEYETLMVEIGEGKGKNWWCVMFPPLCFIEFTDGYAANAKNDLEEVLSDAEVSTLLAEKDPPLILKSKLLEILQKTKVYIASRLAERN